MKKLLKWSGIALGSLALVVAATVAVLVAISISREGTKYDVRVDPIPIPNDAESLAEGERLYVSRGCAECHAEDGTGRVVFDAPPARVTGTNLTVVTQGWSVEDHVRAIRNGVRPDGSPVLFMPSHELYGMSDAELGRIIAYYTHLPRRETDHPPSEVRLLGRVLHAAGLFPLYPAEIIDHDAPRPRAPEPAETVEYGEYLAVGCRACHGENFSGGPIPGAPPELGVPSNLTPHPTGLGDWTREQFFTAMRTGVLPDGRQMDDDQMPWRNFARMTDVELGALWAYLQQLPPREEGNR